jgi:predicted TIM-barrel fold metal-dependent hydrolase
MKLGGLGMKLFGFGFGDQDQPPTSEICAEAWRPYIEACIEAFGVDRCMFESNFPVDKGTCGYREIWNAFKRITSGASAAEKTALYSGTAARIYKLDPVS